MNVAKPTWSHAAERPAAVALRAGETEWSYLRLRDGAARFAGGLIAAGIEPGDRVMLVAPSVPEFVAPYLGVHAAGAVAVTPNVMSTVPELEYVTGDAGCSLIVAWHEAEGAAARTSTPHMAALVDLVEECGGKLVCIGDPRQIGAVGPGGLYGRLTTVTEPAVLTKIRRQQDPYDRRVVELAREGRGSDALDLLRVRDRLVIADTLEESLDAMVLDWHRSFSAGEDAVMIARRSETSPS